MPDPIQASDGSRVMLAKVMTAMEFSGAATSPRLPLLRDVEPCLAAESSRDCRRVRSTNIARASWYRISGDFSSARRTTASMSGVTP